MKCKTKIVIILALFLLSSLPNAFANTITVPTTVYFGFMNGYYINFSSQKTFDNLYRSNGYWYFNDYGFQVQDADMTITQYFSSNQLKFTLYADSGTSTTKIYVNTLGLPTYIIGADSWNYNNTSKIITITVVHASSRNIIITWSGGGTITGSEPPESGDWEIDEDTIVNSTIVYVNGSINIRSPYTFAVYNSTIYMNNGSYNGEFGIYEENGATFIGYSSNFLNNTIYRYKFTIDGMIYFNYCEIRGFGYSDDYPGVKIHSNSGGSSLNNTIIHKTYSGIYLASNAHDLYFENVTVHDADSSGFFLINAYNNTFVNTNSYFNEYGYMVYEPSHDNYFINTVAHNNTKHGYWVFGNSSYNTFNGSIAYFNGVEMRPFPEYPPIPSPWYYGILVSGNYNVFNTCETYEEFSGFDIWGGYNNFTNCIAHDIANGYYGFWDEFYGDGHNRFENCITYNITHGITLSNYAVCINHTAYNGLEGVLMGDVQDVLVENCTSHHMLSDGFVVAGNYGDEPFYTNIILRNNTAYYCSGPGFGFGMYSANVTVDGGTSHDNYYGVGFYENASHITIIELNLYNNTHDFNFGFNSKDMHQINISNSPSIGKICFQNIPPLDFQKITLEILSGIWNTSETNVHMINNFGNFSFIATNNAEIEVTYTPSILWVKINGSRIQSGEVIIINDTGETFVEWQWETMLPEITEWGLSHIMTWIGMGSGLGLVIVPCIIVYAIKKEHSIEDKLQLGIVFMTIWFVLLCLVIGWLWS